MRSILKSIILASLVGTLPWLNVAHAQAVPVVANSFTYGSSGGSLVSGTINSLPGARQWAANATAGAVNIGDTVVAKVAANDVAMLSTRTLPWVGVAKGAARALPYIGTGLLIWQAFDAIRCHADGTTGLLCDPGVPSVIITQGVWMVLGTSFQGASAQAACSAYAASFNAGYGTHLVNVTANGGGCYPTSAGADISSLGRTMQRQETQTPGCTDGSSIGADGLCPTKSFQPTTFDAAGDKLANVAANKANAVQIAKDAAATGVDLAPLTGPASLTGPAVATGAAQVTTTTPPATQSNPNPTPQTTTTYPTYNFNYNANNYAYTTTNTTTAPDGSTKTETVPESSTCGIAGKPACIMKVDETGTPNAGDYSAAATALDQAKTDAVSGVTSAAAAQGKDTSWGFGFAFPTGCSEYSIPELGFTTNVCTWQPLIHDLMAMIWIASTVWCCIGMVGRTTQTGA